MRQRVDETCKDSGLGKYGMGATTIEESGLRKVIVDPLVSLAAVIKVGPVASIGQRRL